MKRQEPEHSNLTFAYRVASVDRLGELREDLSRLDGEGRLSENETFRTYLNGLSFDLPADFPGARSIIVLAIPTPLMWVRFHLDGETHDVMVPPQYYQSGVTAQDLRDALLSDVVVEPGCDAVRANSLQLKPLAVRSGLARYGRNNICYVDGMGSLLTLHAYFTDTELEEDCWGDVRFMETCEDCNLCLRSCPCGCIDRDNPVVDVGRCVTLYNEIPSEFPPQLDGDAHNSLMGCMACQLCCPENRGPLQRAGRLEDISQRETQRILDGNPDSELFESLSRKLRGFPPATCEEYFPIMTRNLRVLLEKHAQ